MLEDEQRFEELEAKLAALSSQVEGLELEKEVDPFFEDDVRRLIEDFREKEIVEVEEDADLDDSDESTSEQDFISVQTSGGRTFKVHWIAPESCENMTKASARAAFASSAATRYGTSQQVNGGDLMILLCRAEESESEPQTVENNCHYIGMAVNIGVNPTSIEPQTSGFESVTSRVGNYEIFVWSSCECSEGEKQKAEILKISTSLGSSSSNLGQYLAFSSSDSPTSTSVSLAGDVRVSISNFQSPASLDDVINPVFIAEDQATLGTHYLKIDSMDRAIQQFKTVTLEQDINSLEFTSSSNNLDKIPVGSKDLGLTSSEVSVDECGNLSTVSIGNSSLNIVSIGSSSSDFIKAMSELSVSVSNTTTSQATYDAYELQKTTGLQLVPNSRSLFIPALDANKETVIPDTGAASFIANVDLSVSKESISGFDVIKNANVVLTGVARDEQYFSGLRSTDGTEVSILSSNVINEIDLSQVKSGEIKSLTGLNAVLRSDDVLSISTSYKPQMFEAGLLKNVSIAESTFSQTVNLNIPRGTNITGNFEENHIENLRVSLNSSGDYAVLGTKKSKNLGVANGFVTSLGTELSSNSEQYFTLPKTSLSGSIIESSIDRISVGKSLTGASNEYSPTGVFKNKRYTVENGAIVSVSLANETKTFGDYIIGPPALSADFDDKYLSNISISKRDGSNTYDISGNYTNTTYTINTEQGTLVSLSSSDPNPTSLGSFEVSIGNNVSGNFVEKNLSDLKISLGSDGRYNITGTQTSKQLDVANGFVTSIGTETSSPVNFGSFEVATSAVSLGNGQDGSFNVKRDESIDVTGNYSQIYYDENTGDQIGDAYYYVEHSYFLDTVTYEDGFVSSVSLGTTKTTTTEGPIIVPGTYIRYGCVDGSCVEDPAGTYDDPNCGGQYCKVDEYAGEDPEYLLTYRPPLIIVYGNGTECGYPCFTEISRHEISGASGLDTQSYSNNGELKSVAGVDTFYVNGVEQTSWQVGELANKCSGDNRDSFFGAVDVTYRYTASDNYPVTWSGNSPLYDAITLRILFQANPIPDMFVLEAKNSDGLVLDRLAVLQGEDYEDKPQSYLALIKSPFITSNLVSTEETYEFTVPCGTSELILNTYGAVDGQDGTAFTLKIERTA